MKTKMLHMMNAEEDLDSTKNIKARAEAWIHEAMLGQIKPDLGRQRQNEQRNNMIMMMMLGFVMRKKISPEDIHDGI